ncbi:MAG: alpha/beta fold hydrolase [Chloroflexota bacterium]
MKRKKNAALPNPTQSYEEAIERAEKLQAADTDSINPLCHTKLLTHGQQVERVIVLLHGFTSCPHQYNQLAQLLFDQGYNVFIPRVPRHGLLDYMTKVHASLTPADLMDITDEAVDIAQGLGRHVTVAGLSMGGVLTSWAAQYRHDIDLAVIISPAFGMYIAPVWVHGLVTYIFRYFPNFFRWWDPVNKGSGRVGYVYPRLSSRGLGNIMWLGSVIRRARVKPAAQSMLMVINHNDIAVNNQLINKVVNIWKKYDAPLSIHEFDASLGFTHDLVDPEHPQQKIDEVYPRLVALIKNGGGSEAL